VCIVVRFLDPAPKEGEGGREGGRAGKHDFVSLCISRYPPSFPPSSLPPSLPEVARVPRKAVNEELGLAVCLLHRRPIVKGRREGGRERKRVINWFRYPSFLRLLFLSLPRFPPSLPT